MSFIRMVAGVVSLVVLEVGVFYLAVLLPLPPWLLGPLAVAVGYFVTRFFARSDPLDIRNWKGR